MNNSKDNSSLKPMALLLKILDKIISKTLDIFISIPRMLISWMPNKIIMLIGLIFILNLLFLEEYAGASTAKLIAVTILSIGAIFNILAVSLNNWKMPVISEEEDFQSEGKLHRNMKKEDIRLPILSDFIHYRHGVASIGDILILTGLIGALIL